MKEIELNHMKKPIFSWKTTRRVVYKRLFSVFSLQHLLFIQKFYYFCTMIADMVQPLRLSRHIVLGVLAHERDRLRLHPSNLLT